MSVTNHAIGSREPQRVDIQALRGIAVLYVLFFHVDYSWIPAGYLGVDVFFVISGFLITNIVTRGLADGTFQFSRFYFRRATRLLPAAYATYLVTAIAVPFFLPRSDWDAFVGQVVGAIGFVANLVLWRQSDYFNGEAGFKPLLHIWSLAVEEQYYLFLPLLLKVIPTKYWKAFVVLGFVSSLLLCLWMNAAHPTLSFYSLPTRAWELCIGSAGAIWLRAGGFERLNPTVGYVALIVLIAIPLFPLPGAHPGVNAALVCIATLTLINTKIKVLNKGPIAYGLSKVGDVSYSLYLIHWPIIAFYNNASFRKPSSGEQCVLIVASLIAGFLMNWLIENRFRYVSFAKSSKRTVTTAVTSSAAIIMLVTGYAHAVSSTKPDPWRPNAGLSAMCDGKSAFEAKSECMTSPNPEILVWGDSFAMHLVAGIVASAGEHGIAQATSSACGPLLGVTPTDVSHAQKWVKDCVHFNQSVLDYVQRTPSVKVVVLSSLLSQYVDAGTKVVQDDGSITAGTVDIAVTGLDRTISSLRKLGKQVVIVAPPPSSGIDSGRCVNRMDFHLPMVGAPRDCNFSVQESRAHLARPLDVLSRVSTSQHVNVIRLDDALCDQRLCSTHVGDMPIYRDVGHLTYLGSELVGKRLQLSTLIFQEAS